MYGAPISVNSRSTPIFIRWTGNTAGGRIVSSTRQSEKRAAVIAAGRALLLRGPEHPLSFDIFDGKEDA